MEENKGDDYSADRRAKTDSWSRCSFRGYHNSGEVIGTALTMLHEDIEDGIISDARAGELRFSLDEVEAELRALGKIR